MAKVRDSVKSKARLSFRRFNAILKKEVDFLNLLRQGMLNSGLYARCDVPPIVELKTLKSYIGACY